MSPKYSRRAFLAGLGLGPGLLPLLARRHARAGCLAKPPRRLITIVLTNGVLDWASGDGTSYSLPGFMKGLEPYKGDIIPIKGVKLQNLKDTPNPQKADNAGHGASPAVLTGRRYADLRPFVEVGGGPSVDQWVAADLVKRGIRTPRASLTLGCAWEGYVSYWRDASQKVSPNNDPWAVFSDVFTGQRAVTDPNYAKMQMASQSVLDLVTRDLAAFKARVGAANARTIDAHLTSVRELENNLKNMPTTGVGCSPPNIGAKGDTSAKGFDKVFKAHMDIAVAAFAADVTRVVGIQLGNEGNQHIIPYWLGFNLTGDNSSGVGDASSMHSIAHRGGADKTKLDTWYHDQFAYLIGKLKAEKEADGSTMLDNTAVLVVNHMANGGSHSTDNVPFLLAGRCGGYFKPGRAVTVADISHSAILKEVILAMGADPAGFFQPEYDMILPALRG